MQALAPWALPHLANRRLEQEDEFPYAYGWLVLERPWAKGTALAHDGSNTMFYATAWLAPELGRAYVAVTNQGDAAAPVGTDAAIGLLLQESGAL
ncbi:MAG: hypothetical protein OXU20_15410 [Myxococcales bacterium]|nr:hypothetical protein [Myxococcales bacterium]MDD9968929.1 hypothetical protein [Myxococcales bacterium]